MYPLERTPPARRGSDGTLYMTAAFITIAVIALVGWAVWYRAQAGNGAVAARGTGFQAPTTAPVPELAPAERPDACIGPIDPRPRPRPRKEPSASRPVKRSEPIVSPVAQPAAPAAPPVRAGNEGATAAPAVEESRVPIAPSAGPAPVDRPVISAVTYSADDADVHPPTAISPQLITLLSRPSPGNRPDVMTIAVVVNPNGTVESVKAVHTPLTLGESVMLTAALSAVKAWHFRPAIKDGAPVKYRQIVPLRISGSAP
jgi:outer membrane biosynthesis protein TonB